MSVVRMPSRAGLAVLAVLIVAGVASAGSAATTAPAVQFVERAHETGLDFRHDNGMQGKLYIVEAIGSGLALFDCDGDGDLDILMRQAGPVDGSGQRTDRLYRNDLVAGRPETLHFTDVSAGSGFDRPAVGMGVAVGDYDGDGRPDVYLTNYGPNRLLRNLGDCRFEDVTGKAGAAHDGWTVPATFFDMDGDGDLDLFFGDYVDFSPGRRVTCRSASSRPDFCGPDAYGPLPKHLLRNDGGKFVDVTVASGIAEVRGKALGIVAFDADGDGRTDLFVGNDAMDNELWMNRGGGRFVDEGAERGCAVNGHGSRTGDMGISAADVDGDGDEDLISTHIDTEGLSFWVNDGAGFFRDLAAPAGMLLATRGHTGFGTVWIDADNDGLPDLYLANGAVRLLEDEAAAGDPLPLHESDQIFRNLAGGRFAEISSSAGAYFSASEVGRGVAAGDLDNDGDSDLVISNSGGPARLLIDAHGQDNAWVGLRVLDRPGGRDALGARVTLRLAHGRRLVRRCHTDGSYASAGDPRVLFGLGAEPGAVAGVEVEWPDGRRESFPAPPLRAYSVLVEGSGQAAPRAP
jgi:enediyne biosynthesis protein E4